jgi:uncharacterized Tic20 family protein
MPAPAENSAEDYADLPSPARSSAGEDPPENARTMAMLVWVLYLVLGPLFALILYLVKRKESRFVDWHGKQGLNLFVTHYLLLAVLLLVFAVGVGAGFLYDLPILSLVVGGIVIVLIIALLLFGLVVKIIAAIKANKGERWKPPLCLRVFK